MHNSPKGVTLLELTVALAVWMLLATGIFALWQHASASVERNLTRQSAFENARGVMDALIINVQLSSHIMLEATANDEMRRLTLTERNPQGHLHDYVFEFTPGGNYRVLFGANEFASGIAAIYITYVSGRRIDITVSTICAEPIVLHGSVDARYKFVTVRVVV